MTNQAPTTSKQQPFDDEALKNLAGYLDVLVQMDLLLKEQERKRDEDH